MCEPTRNRERVDGPEVCHSQPFKREASLDNNPSFRTVHRSGNRIRLDLSSSIQTSSDKNKPILVTCEGTENKNNNQVGKVLTRTLLLLFVSLALGFGFTSSVHNINHVGSTFITDRHKTHISISALRCVSHSQGYDDSTTTEEGERKKQTAKELLFS